VLGRVRQCWFKCRQPGGSTAASGAIAHLSFLNPYVYSLVVAHDKPTVQNIFDMYETFHSNMNPLVRPLKRYFTKGQEMVLENPDEKTREFNPGLKSKITVGEAKNIHLGPGRTIHGLHCSEVSRYPAPEDIKDGLLPALSDAPGTVAIIESAAHYAEGAVWFHDLCERAMRGESDFEYHFMQWWKMPEYWTPLADGEKLKLDPEERRLVREYELAAEQIKWRRRKIEELESLELFYQSYPMTFAEAWISKDSAVFPRERLMDLRMELSPPLRKCEIVDNGMIVDDPKGRLCIWFEPVPGQSYDIGADLGSGAGQDYTAAVVIERGTFKQVAEWHGNIDPFDFADVLAAMGRYYNMAQIGPEVERYGNMMIGRLVAIYPKIYVWRKWDQVVPRLTQMLGWETNSKSKQRIVSFARHLIWHKKAQIFSSTLWKELLNFVQFVSDAGNIQYGARPGAADDLAMAWMIALMISEDECFGRHSSHKTVEAPPEARPDDRLRFDLEREKIITGHRDVSEEWKAW
jgi:hypothetical protein